MECRRFSLRFSWDFVEILVESFVDFLGFLQIVADYPRCSQFGDFQSPGASGVDVDDIDVDDVDAGRLISHGDAEVAAEGASILVLPELFIGGYETEKPATRAIHADGSEIQRAAHAAKTNGVAVVFGFAEHPAKADESEMKKREVAQAAQATDSALAPAVFNSAVAIGEDGVVR